MDVSHLVTFKSWGPRVLTLSFMIYRHPRTCWSRVRAFTTNWTHQAKIQGAFVAHGQGFVSADLQTETQSSLQRIRLRLPESLVLQKNLGDGCIVRTEPTPLRFYRDTPIISLVTEAELEVLSCPETQAAPLENTPRKANTVVISELMPRPSTGLSTTDQWFELFNTQTEPVNLRGCHIRRGGEDTPILIRESMPIAPAYLLVKTSEAADTLQRVA